MFNFMSWLNLTLSFLIVGYAAFLFFRGRRINRGMMLLNVVAGLYIGTVYILLAVDQFFMDILTAEIFRVYCIKPAVFFLLCVILAWTVRSGWRDEN